MSLKTYEAWFVCGSQHLYGQEILDKVDAHSKVIAEALDAALPIKVLCKPVVKSSEEIENLCLEAVSCHECCGIICWMHTFSPAKMWIHGLGHLSKPMVHLHTQFNRDIPWGEIDMDFMNLNQSAHGDREYGFICSRLRLNRKVVVGHWQDSKVQHHLSCWARAACGWHEWQHLKVARLGDNMREVAVTEGDKVQAQLKLGFSSNGYAVGDLVKYIDRVSDDEVKCLVEKYKQLYELDTSVQEGGSHYSNLLDAARIEIGLRKFLINGGFGAFTDTFENLQGLSQLPGLPVQRLMNEGFGFGAEGDWKTAALLRAVFVMSRGCEAGSSFMEDYTYHLDPEKQLVLGAHMLEVCPQVASKAKKPVLCCMPLSIGGKSDPPRLVFDGCAGRGVNASLVDMGGRFRLLVNTIDVVAADKPPVKPMTKLPVARVLWSPHPNFADGCQAWILAGGAHHTVFTQAIDAEVFEDFARIAGIEISMIDEKLNIRSFCDQLRWNDLYYHLSQGLGR